MQRFDPHDNPVSPSAGSALEAYAAALSDALCWRGDPLAAIAPAIEREPAFAMGQLLKAWLLALGTEPAGLREARAVLRRVGALDLVPRELAHALAIEDFVAGRWASAARRLEDLSIMFPRDALALQAGHVIDFLRGDSSMLRERIGRALGEWPEDAPGFHALLGMYAFGCEENGDYRRAETFGRRALQLEPGDAWAHHAVAHVFEMEGRSDEGLAWMAGRQPHWMPENYLAVHNAWHWALFHLDQGEPERALALYDGPVQGGRSALIVDLIDATALLWRLTLAGTDVGPRWQAVADAWQAVAEPGAYVFNDVHAQLAWIGAGRTALAESNLAAQHEAARCAQGDHADSARLVGQPLLRALQDFAAGRHGRTVEGLRHVRAVAQRMGGSHAQRDLIDLLLIEAALRDGQSDLARGLIEARLRLRPPSPARQRLAQRAAA